MAGSQFCFKVYYQQHSWSILKTAYNKHKIVSQSLLGQIIEWNLWISYHGAQHHLRLVIVEVKWQRRPSCLKLRALLTRSTSTIFQLLYFSTQQWVKQRLILIFKKMNDWKKWSFGTMWHQPICHSQTTTFQENWEWLTRLTIPRVDPETALGGTHICERFNIDWLAKHQTRTAGKEDGEGKCIHCRMNASLLAYQEDSRHSALCKQD